MAVDEPVALADHKTPFGGALRQTLPKSTYFKVSAVIALVSVLLSIGLFIGLTGPENMGNAGFAGGGAIVFVLLIVIVPMALSLPNLLIASVVTALSARSAGGSPWPYVATGTVALVVMAPFLYIWAGIEFENWERSAKSREQRAQMVQASNLVTQAAKEIRGQHFEKAESLLVELRNLRVYPHDDAESADVLVAAHENQVLKRILDAWAANKDLTTEQDRNHAPRFLSVAQRALWLAMERGYGEMATTLYPYAKNLTLCADSYHCSDPLVDQPKTKTESLKYSRQELLASLMGGGWQPSESDQRGMMARAIKDKDQSYYRYMVHDLGWAKVGVGAVRPVSQLHALARAARELIPDAVSWGVRYQPSPWNESGTNSKGNDADPIASHDTPLHELSSSPESTKIACGDKPEGLCIQHAKQWVDALVKAGNPIDAKDRKGWTPLLSAAESTDVLMMVALLQAGANPSYRTPEGDSAGKLLDEHIYKFNDTLRKQCNRILQRYGIRIPVHER